MSSLADQIVNRYVSSVFDTVERSFLPDCYIAELITEASIIKELDNEDGILEMNKEKDLVSFILQYAKRVFATTLVSGVEGSDLIAAMRNFKGSNFQDECLPVSEDDLSTLQCFQDKPWTTAQTHNFFQNQYIFLAPVFSKTTFRIDLEPGHILPFTWIDKEIKDGTFSEVFQVKIHESHQADPIFTIEGDRANVAIKKIKDIKQIANVKEVGSNDELQEKVNKEWEDEAKALDEISGLNHPNIIQRIAAITRGRERYFMFQWADGGSLREFWESLPDPSLDQDLVREIVQQLRGLADALNELHKYKGSYHGDLKPENILRFRDHTPIGILKIADMGLAKHHTVATRLRLPTNTRYGTVRYETPEAMTHHLSNEGRSSLYDIWPMGCITLELIVWLLYGYDELKEFNETKGSLQELSPYFEVKSENGIQLAKVHRNIRYCIDHISKDLESSGTTAMRDLLEIVKTNLLVVPLPQPISSSFGLNEGDSSVAVTHADVIDQPANSSRATAKALRDLLDGMIGKGKKNRNYWFTGNKRDGLRRLRPVPVIATHNNFRSPNLAQRQKPIIDRRRKEFPAGPSTQLVQPQMQNDGTKSTGRTLGVSEIESMSELGSESIKRLLRRSIFNNDSTSLRLLFDKRPKVVIEEYPWVEELLCEDFHIEEVLELLLKSENLSWVPTDHNDFRPHKGWIDIFEFEHHEWCGHRIKSHKGNESQSVPLISGGDSQKRREHHGSTKQGKTESVDFSKSLRRDPEEHFPELERREQELINICGAGGVFSPEYSGSTGQINPGYSLMLQNTAQIMYGTAPISTSDPVNITAEDPALLFYEDHWVGKEIDIISVYNQNPSSSYDFTTNEEGSEFLCQADMILVALENVLSAIELLHKEAECCDRITIIIKPTGRDEVLELRTIHSTSLRDLCIKLEEIYEYPRTRPPAKWTKTLANLCQDILSRVGCGDLASEHLKATSGSSKLPSLGCCLHLCALIAQMASLAVVTYSRGHSREFYTETLTRPIEVFILGGLEHDWASICAERVELKCMGKMLGRKVWMFHQDKKSINTFTDPFWISAEAEDILDTWGGWVSTQKSDEGRLEMCIHTGGGSIESVAYVEVESIVTGDEIYCHWSPEVERGAHGQPFLPLDARLLIGATKVNENCCLTDSACQAAIVHNLVTLGTREPSWKTTGRNIGISGGQYINASVGLSQTKDDGRNMKQRIIDDYRQHKDLRKLNSPWGLELSLCTGIARRVSLRQLMYGESLKYLQLGLPGEWEIIENIASTISKKSDSEFETLLETLTIAQADVLRKAVELLIIAMESTGVGRDGHTLTLWWPERDAPTPRGLKFTKTQYSGEKPWIPMIADSDHCAVFGMATTRCLQHDDIKKCRHTALPAEWQDVNKIILDTTLSPAERFQILLYAKDERYLLWKRQDFLQVTKPKDGAARGATTGVVQLTYSPGWTKPHIVYIALRNRAKVKEKQGLKDPGQVVLIL